MPRWAGPVTDEVNVKDLLDYDALPEETRLLVERVVKHRLREDPENRDRVSELEEELEEAEQENTSLRAALEKIADGEVRAEDVEVFAKGALAA